MKNTKRHTTPQFLNGAIKNICDIMRRSNCAPFGGQDGQDAPTCFA